MDLHSDLGDASAGFPCGGGQMGVLIREHDWTSSPLGPLADWPQSLKSAVDLVLGSPLPMVVLWGPDLIQIYNDGYARVCGPKHPQALARPTRECWAEVWSFNAPIYAAVLQGETRAFVDQELPLEREGVAEEAWFDLNYSPLRDEACEITGVLVVVVETTTRVVAERQLALRMARQRKLFEQAPGFVCIFSSPGHVYEFANEAYMQLVGRRDLIGKTVREAMPDIEGQGFYELLDQVYRSGERYVASDVSIQMHRTPGQGPEERLVDFMYEPIFDAAEVVMGVFAQGHDVTEAHATGALLRAKQRSRAVLNALDDTLRDLSEPSEMMLAAAALLGEHLKTGRCGFSEIESGGQFVTVANEWNSGRMPSGVGRFRMDDFGPFIQELRAGRAVRMTDTLDSAMSAGADLDATYSAVSIRSALAVPILQGGQWVAAVFAHEMQPRRWTDEEETIARDVAERTWGAVGRTRAEAALRASEASLRALNADLESQVRQRVRELGRTWEVSPDLLAILNNSGYFDSANPAWQTVLGWSPDETLSTLVFDFIHPDDVDQSRDAFRRLLAGEPILQFENRYAHKAGGWRWLSWNVVPEGGRNYCSARDITDDKDREAELNEVEEHLRQAQKMEAVGQLTGGIAHDFNNMLTGILGGLDIIQRRIVAGRFDDIDRYIDAARQSGERAASLTRRLLAFSRRQSLELRVLDLNAMARGMEEMLSRTLGASVALRLDLQPELWPVEADAGQMESALLNLAINGRDAMPKGGPLTIETSNVADDDVARRPRDLKSGDYVRISVRDEGSGMSLTTLERAFDPFFTTKAIGQGTGLGLSMTYGFVKQSGGHVAISSAPGQGTTVTLWLPRAAGRAAEVAAPAPSEARPAPAGASILVVDDEPAVRLLITEVLGEAGYALVTADSAEDALTILRSRHALDLLVTDVGLPGMNGRQLAEMARSLRPDLPVLFVTGYAETATVRGEFLGDGMDMVAKPFGINALSEKVRDMLAGA